MRQLTKNEEEAANHFFAECDIESGRASTDRALFKAGFIAGLEYQDKRIEALEKQISDIQLQYNGIVEQAKYTKNPVITTGLATAITGKTLFEVTK